MWVTLKHPVGTYRPCDRVLGLGDQHYWHLQPTDPPHSRGCRDLNCVQSDLWKENALTPTIDGMARNMR